MYYEEKMIDGVLHCRGTPDGQWHKAALSAMPAVRVKGIDEGRFETWTLADFAGQCRMQARDNLDHEYCQFMEALAARLSAIEPAGVGVETAKTERMSDLERKIFEILTHGFPAPFARVRDLSRRIAALKGDEQ